MRTIATMFFAIFAMSQLSLATTPEEWRTKLKGTLELKFFLTTKSEVLRNWGMPDQNLPRELKSKGVIQYVYEGDNSLTEGCPPAVRFIDDKERLIEVSLGFAFGPPFSTGDEPNT